MQSGVKALVVACNTVSAVALDMLRAEFDLPVIGVIEPGARAALQALQLRQGQGPCGPAGVLGTQGTILSGAYPRAMAQLSTRYEVHGQAAPLLVSLVEEGWLEGEVPRLAVERYLAPLIQRNIRVIVLGCTHYPLLKAVIERVAAELAGEPVVVVDSAESTAQEIVRLMQSGTIARNPGKPTTDRLRLMVTDLPAGFQAVAQRFLGRELPAIDQIDLASE